MPLSLRILVYAALVAGCHSEDDEGVSWETSESNPEEVPLVDNGAAATEIPDRIPIEMVLGTSPARSYVGTTWDMVDGPPTEPVSIAFEAEQITYVSPDGSTRTVAATYGPEHEACLDFPGCVITVSPSGLMTVHHLYREGNQFWFVRCIDYGSPDAAPTDEELSAVSNVAVWRSETVACIAHMDQAGYMYRSIVPPDP